MEAKENVLEKGNIYTEQDLGDYNCKFVKKTNNVIFFRKEDLLFVFDSAFYKDNGKYKLLSILEE